MLCLITCNTYKLQHVGKKSQDLDKKFNGHNFCSRNPSVYSFCEILNAHSRVIFLNFVPKTQYNLSCIIKKKDEAGHEERDAVDYEQKSVAKTREKY